MKRLFTLLAICSWLNVLAINKTFDKLAEVNKCWLEQRDVTVTSLPNFTIQSETEWIRTHLTLVEQTLRARTTSHLTPSQKQNRQNCLNHLNEYWHAGNFPINDQYAYRTPIFIDRYNNFCAVGYLIKATGNESVSRMIASKTNLAYVRQMNYTEVFAWANENGFTEDELAWIQPAYPPVRHSAPVGKGTDGTVYELYADNANGKLYVGGKFQQVDSTITANNIAYVTESGGAYTWHALGSGVNGEVHAIVPFNNNLFVAGSFTQAGSTSVNNIAYWDGSMWHAAGCLTGKVKDLIVYNNELYAAGQFDLCAGLIDVNFARWDGTTWTGFSGLIGQVNTMEVEGSDLLLGGNFNYGSLATNVIKWNSTNGFVPFTNGLENEVNDFEKYGDTVYAVSARTAVNDSNLVNKLISNTWLPESPYLTSSFFSPQAISFNTLCNHNDTFMMGGSFYLLPIVGNTAQNTYSLFNPGGLSNWMNVDSAVYKMTIFKGELIAAGKFKYGSYGLGWNSVPLNGITRKVYSLPTSVQDLSKSGKTMLVYPNPASAASSLIVENSFGADQLSVSDLRGKIIVAAPVSGSKISVKLPQLSAGTYIVELRSKAGQSASQKLIIQ